MAAGKASTSSAKRTSRGGSPPGVEGLKAVADLAKQIITLGSALIGVTVTFADKFHAHETGKPVPPPPALNYAWTAYIASVLFAVLTLMAVAGSMNEIDVTGTEKHPERTNTKVWGFPMLFTFVIGLALTAIAGCQAMR
jgi:hypothetical protein